MPTKHSRLGVFRVCCLVIAGVFLLSLLALWKYPTWTRTPQTGVHSTPQHLVTKDSPALEGHRMMLDDLAQFQPVQGRGMFTFTNVCIEDLAATPDVDTLVLAVRNVTYNISRQIVVYNSHFSSDYRHFLVGVPSNLDVHRSSWHLKFTRKPVPKTHEMVDRVAYFLTPTCLGNLHHFWEELFVLLYSVLHSTNRLLSHTANQVIYRYPWQLAPEDADCYDIHTYEELLFTLNIHPTHDWFGNLKHNICFPQAVFGMADSQFSPRSVVDYAMSAMGIHYSECPRRTITLVQRTRRRILNMAELARSVSEAGYHLEVQVVQFENLTIGEQMRTAACSSVLVGVQGAGLQWAAFMQQHNSTHPSTLVEIAWPRLFWDFYFHNTASRYGLSYVPVEALTVHPNWRTYELRFRGGRELTEEERHLVATSVPRSRSQDNIWKWADVTVDVNMLVKTLADHLTK